MSVCDGRMVETVGSAEDMTAVEKYFQELEKVKYTLTSISFQYHVPAEHPYKCQIRPLHMLGALLLSQ